jgi:hypothetical protein
MVPNILTNQSGSGGALAKTVAMSGWGGGVGGGHKWVNPNPGEFANRIANMTVGIISCLVNVKQSTRVSVPCALELNG